MDSIFKITKSSSCGITVTGLEKDNSEYLAEDASVLISTRNYAYSHTVTLNIFNSVSSAEQFTPRGSQIISHEGLDECGFTFSIDGLYQVTHMIMPTSTWLEYVLAHDSTALSAYTIVYYYDTVNNKICKYGSTDEVTIDEIFQINSLTTTIIRGDKLTFSICKLQEQLYCICKALFADLLQCKTSTQNRQYRDITWMAINVIKYLLDTEQYYEAQHTLEKVSSCTTTITTTTNGCNCKS